MNTLWYFKFLILEHLCSFYFLVEFSIGQVFGIFSSLCVTWIQAVDFAKSINRRCYRWMQNLQFLEGPPPTNTLTIYPKSINCRCMKWMFSPKNELAVTYLESRSPSLTKFSIRLIPFSLKKYFYYNTSWSLHKKDVRKEL